VASWKRFTSKVFFLLNRGEMGNGQQWQLGVGSRMRRRRRRRRRS
jgi:hypothetical protein